MTGRKRCRRVIAFPANRSGARIWFRRLPSGRGRSAIGILQDLVPGRERPIHPLRKRCVGLGALPLREAATNRLRQVRAESLH